jgi:hypothetical protein
MTIDWPLTISLSTAVLTSAAWIYERFTYRGPNLSFENGVANQESPQRTVVMPFGQLPPRFHEAFPEYAPNLNYALATLVWLNLGDRAGAVYLKDIKATAQRCHLECSWYSYVSIPPSSVHTETILIRGLPDLGETEVAIAIDYEWLKIRWWRFGKSRRLLRKGKGQFTVIVTKPVIPMSIVRNQLKT